MLVSACTTARAPAVGTLSRVKTVGRVAMPIRVEVELDIFSGMPNPTWVLAGPDAETLATRIASLPRIPTRDLSGNLGYRGFIVRMLTGTQTRLIRIQAGTVQISDDTRAACAKDENRGLERWLLNSGRPHLANDLLEIVESELR